ncbi:MAG: zinc-binding dehydrogenase [Luteitalea sp.]|nr:zinc-binding dehydrogenase [Luteitalea sp.]
MEIPESMTVVGVRQPGGPDVLELETRPVPEPGTSEILIRVQAAGVNRPDVLQRQGKYPPPPGASDILGLEVAGTVVKCGSGVTRWVAGESVCALLAGGGYAEYVVAPEPQCLPLPEGLTAREAAVLPETFFTVWTNLFDRGRLEKGETLLVHGGASGIGTTAIQTATAFGATVYATAGTSAKCDACLRLGATRAVNYRDEDFLEVLRAETAGRGIDVILDIVGGDYFPKNIALLAVEGRLVQIAFLRGTTVSLDLADIMRRRLTITASVLRSRTVAEKGAIAKALLRHVWPLLAAGRVRPVIHGAFPLREVAAAHRLMEAGEHIGKIVLDV